MFRYILMLCLFSIGLMNGRIIEIKEMKEAFQEIDQDTLIIFDIDNTLIEPIQELGNDQWFRHRIRVHELHGSSSDDALERALAEWMSVQCITEVKLVEPGIDQLIQDLQNKGHMMLGLTTRGLGMATRTAYQLQSLGIDLSKSVPSKEDYLFENGHSCLFRHGIIFTANSHKGNALEKLLTHLKLTPKKIIFINDKYSHMIPVDEKCEELKIPFIGYRYSYLDHKVENFQSDVADLQFERFRFILSDHEAMRMLTRITENQ
ncbi:MAG: DUF2608 domain-containing protein [Simkaniaceae bacterium]|nr:DUF2608 domain-containing protein [Simkaniaceae bacterium]